MSEPTTKDRIRQEALRLFAEHGVAGVSVRDIAEAVGMSKPNLYAHYKNMEGLVADLFQNGYGEYGRRLREAADGGATFQDKLEAMVRLICRLHDEDATLFRFLLLTQHGNLTGVARDGENNPVEVLARTVAAGMASGEIPAADPALVTAAIVGLVIQPATFRVYGRITRSLTEMADEIVAMARKVVS